MCSCHITITMHMTKYPPCFCILQVIKPGRLLRCHNPLGYLELELLGTVLSNDGGPRNTFLAIIMVIALRIQPLCIFPLQPDEVCVQLQMVKDLQFFRSTHVHPSTVIYWNEKLSGKLSQLVSKMHSTWNNPPLSLSEHRQVCRYLATHSYTHVSDGLNLALSPRTRLCEYLLTNTPSILECDQIFQAIQVYLYWKQSWTEGGQGLWMSQKCRYIYNNLLIW